MPTPNLIPPWLFEIILESLRNFERPAPAVVKELGPRLVMECRFFGVDWLETDIVGDIGTWSALNK